MSKLRFWLIGIVSFIVATTANVFMPGSLLNRTISVIFCAVFSFNSTFCSVNLSKNSGQVMAAAPLNLQESSKYPEEKNLQLKSFQKTEKIENKTDLQLAFKANHQGHLGITQEFLQAVTITGTDMDVLHFSKKAIQDIVASNRATDIKPTVKDPDATWEYLNTSDNDYFSEDFYIPENHFDNEKFEAASLRLINIKKYIIDELPNPNGSNFDYSLPSRVLIARARLGSALHTIQDFYAHTNWVELGFTEIDKRLGREVIPNPDKLLHPAPKNDADDLLPEFIGTKDITKLTSGYFLGVGPIISCNAPEYKVRHGSFNCDGLNKDEPGQNGFVPNGYKIARKLAKEASYDYLLQIVEKLDPDSVKALMGILDDYCKLEKNKNLQQCQLKEGKSYGDPHLITFDGLRYSFQTVGEYTLVKSNDGQFAVQARQTPVNSNLSLNSAVAMKLGSDRLSFYTKDFPDGDTTTPVRLNGQPTKISGGKISLPGGGMIAQSGNTYVVDSPTGEKVVISPLSAGGNPYFNISILVYNQPTRYSGLLGNVNGNPNDDQEIQDGGNVLQIQSTYGEIQKVFNLAGLRLPGQVNVAEKLYFEQLYKDFGNSWHVKQEESMFDYPSGKTTQNYTDASFPDKYLKLDMLSADQIDKARKQCSASGVDQNLMEGCIFDVGFSGFSDFALAMTEIDGYINIVNQFFPGLNIPTTNQAVDRVIEKIKPKVCLPFVGCL